MHYFNDYIHCEIIDPHTGERLENGEVGELVITTLQKEGAPLINYRTHDLTRFLPGECGCGRAWPRIDTLIGRTDDMVKVKGVIIYPAQVDEVLKEVDGASGEYQVMIDHLNGKDVVTVFFETSRNADKKTVESAVKDRCKAKIGILVTPKGVEIGDLPRSEKKSTRVFDNRY